MIDFVLKKELSSENRVYVEVIDAKNKNDLRKKIRKAKGLVVVGGGSDEINRAALEEKKVDILLSPERGRKKYFIHQRNSGLNHVFCKLAAKNKVAIGFNFSDLLNSRERERLIGMMMQNIKLCRKYKVNMVFGSFASSKWDLRGFNDLISFARVLGMAPGEAKKALNFKKKKKDIELIR